MLKVRPERFGARGPEGDGYRACLAIGAKLPEPDQERWLRLAVKHKMGNRHLARSTAAGRVREPEELEPDPNDKPIETFCVWVNRICGLYRRFLDLGCIAKASREKKEANAAR